MSLETFYIDRISEMKKGNMETYKETQMELLGKELSWTEMQNIDRDKQIEFMIKLEHNIKISKSPYDLKKLAYAIQHSRSGFGGCAMTNFHCAFCGKEELWSNTATPKICKDCASDMAEKIVIFGLDLLKEK